MKPFLAEAAKHVYEAHPGGLEDCCIVFPNRRAVVFFSKYLGNSVEKPIWLPRMLTVNEFITELGGLPIADNLLLTLELHKIYNRIRKSQESFDDFYPWGEILLADFDDIDKYLVNPHDLFQNLSSLRNIENKFNYLTTEQLEIIQTFWKSFDPQKYSGQQKDFIEIWDILEQIYMEFNILLTEKNLAYEGMAFRKVAEQIEAGKALSLPCSKVIFIGFNALNKCEEKIFTFLHKTDIASFYWDYDHYYLEAGYHEAGQFIRENLKKYPSPLDKELFYNLTKDKHLEAISTSSDIGMVKTAGNVLSSLFIPGSKIDFTNTAVVLADENLLLPMLHALPDQIEKVNITMGFPISQSPVYGFLESLFELQKTVRISHGKACFYHKYVIEILDHQLIPGKLKGIKQLKQQIIQSNIVYVPDSMFKDHALLQQIFTHIAQPENLGVYLLDITCALMENTNAKKEGGPELDHEFLYFLHTRLKRLNDILQQQGTSLKKETYIRLIRQIIKGIKVPFTGEPLTGLQVMGLLETRSLDFENIIILSANEGILPKGSLSPSFIPYNLRKGFGLSAMEHQDSIYAYYVYRLLQRAQNITLIYNSSAEGIKSGEMSRFLYQLKYEPAFHLKESTIYYKLVVKPDKAIIIEKNPDIMEELMKYAHQGKDSKYLSPSAINTYLDCTLKFYFNYIARLKEADTLTEEVDAPMFGNILHRAMSILYGEFGRSQINKETIENLAKNKEQITLSILKAFSEEYFAKSLIREDELEGRNIIIKEVLMKYILQLLDLDARLAPLEMISLEQFYRMSIPVQQDEKEITVNVGGKIDRVDKTVEGIRVIDYKTGSARNSYNEMRDLFHFSDPNRNKAVFQVLLYCLLYGNSDKTIPGIYPIKEIYQEDFDFHIKTDKQPIEDFSFIKEEFLRLLKDTMANLFDPKIEFNQTGEEKNCRYCQYIGICGR